MQSPQQKRPHSPTKDNKIQENDEKNPNGDDGKARSSKQRKIINQHQPRIKTKVAATKVPIEDQSFQALVRMFYGNQDYYQGDDPILTNKQRMRRGSDVDLFFRNHVDPQTWWILPTITAEFTPLYKREDQKIIKLLYSEREIWNQYNRPNLQYSDLPSFTDSMMKSIDFQNKWQRARDAIYGAGDGGGNGGAGGDENEDDEMSDGGDADDTNKKWMQLSACGVGGGGGGGIDSMNTSGATAGTAVLDAGSLAGIQCQRAAALLGYYVITKSMRGWKDGKAPQKDSVEYKSNTGNIFFEVPVSITARGPITSVAVLQRLLGALANARMTAQCQFDYIFQASSMLKLQFPTEADRQVALRKLCPFKMFEKDGLKKDQMIRICKKVLEVLSDTSQKVARSQGISISTAMTASSSYHHGLMQSSPSLPSAAPASPTRIVAPVSTVNSAITTTTSSLQVVPTMGSTLASSPVVPIQIVPVGAANAGNSPIAI